MLPEEDRATAIGSIHKKVAEDRTCISEGMIADRHTQTDTLVTMLRSPIGGGVKCRGGVLIDPLSLCGASERVTMSFFYCRK